MSERAWKRTERRIAGLLGGVRVPVNGRRRGSAPDVLHAWLSVEVKSRAATPGWLKDGLAQAVACASSEQLSICVVHEAGQRHDQSLVVLRLSDFVDWYVGEGLEGEA